MEEKQKQKSESPKSKPYVKSISRKKRIFSKNRAKGGLISSSVYFYKKYIDQDATANEAPSIDEPNAMSSLNEATNDEQNIIDANVMNAYVDSSDGLMNMGKAHHAETNLAELKFGNDDIGMTTSVLSASAHCEYGLNNSAGVNASLVRAEGHIGPLKVGTGINFDCNASVGVNGVEASFLGTGFSIGPKIGVKTPFADLSLKLF